MRKKIVVIFFLIFTLAAPQPSIAAVRVGGKCFKSGQTTTIGKNKYTCIKSGSKLIWNKSDLIEIPAKYVPWATPTSKLQISNESKKKFQEWLLAKGDNSENIEISIDPKVAEEKVDYLVQTLKLASKTLLTGKSNKPHMYLSVGDDWAISKIKKDYPKHAAFPAKNLCYEPNPFAGCAWVEDNLIFFVSENSDNWNKPLQGILASGAHEFFHLVQGDLMKNNFELPFYDLVSRIPSWFYEGGASFIGTAYADQSGLANWSKIRDEEISSYAIGRGRNEPLSSFIKNDRDRPSPEGQSHRPYGIGFLACEYIVASTSMENFLDIYRGMGQGLTFSQSFSKATNIELNDFYKKFDSMREKIGFFPVAKG